LTIEIEAFTRNYLRRIGPILHQQEIEVFLSRAYCNIENFAISKKKYLC